MFLRDAYHRFLPAQTSDQVWSSPSWMQLDVGEADRTQSRAPSDALSSCTGHAAADSSQCSSVLGRNECIGGFGKADVSFFFGSADVVWATSKLDRNFWMTRRCSGRQLGVVQEALHVRSPTKIDENCPSCSILGPSLPDDKCPSRVSLCQKPALRLLTVKVAFCMKIVTMSLSLEELRAQGQQAGKQEDSEISDESGPLLVSKSVRVVSGRRHHRLRMLVEHSMCRDGRSEESL